MMKGNIRSSPLAAVLLTSLLPAAMVNFNTTCPAVLTNANATGTVIFSDPIVQQQSPTLSTTKQYTDDNSHLLANDTDSPLTGTSMAYTVSISTTDVVVSGQKLPAVVSALSASFGSVNPFKGSDQWAACALPILNLPPLTTRYGQSDTGNCEATLPYGCVEKILSKVLYSKWTYPSGSNAFERLCAMYGDDITKSILTGDGSTNDNPVLPSECLSLFRTDNKASGELVSKVKGFPITSDNDTTPFAQQSTYECPSVSPRLTGSSIKSYPFTNITTQYNSDTTIASDGNYNEAVRAVYPIITVFFNGKNYNYFGFIPAISASMSCVRVNGFSAGSRISAALEPATPPSLGMSTGKKVGIAIAVIIIVGLVAAALVWVLFFRRRQGGSGKDYGQPRWYQNPKEVFRRGKGDSGGMEKSEYEMMAK